jgi:nucleoside-diphosphate-sugar epimerase
LGDLLLAVLDSSLFHLLNEVVIDPLGFSEGVSKVSFQLPVPSGLASFVAMGKQDLHRQLFGSLVVQNAKARAVLGWEPTRSVYDGLMKVCKWYI